MTDFLEYLKASIFLQDITISQIQKLKFMLIENVFWGICFFIAFCLVQGMGLEFKRKETSKKESKTIRELKIVAQNFMIILGGVPIYLTLFHQTTIFTNGVRIVFILPTFLVLLSCLMIINFIISIFNGTWIDTVKIIYFIISVVFIFLLIGALTNPDSGIRQVITRVISNSTNNSPQ